MAVYSIYCDTGEETTSGATFLDGEIDDVSADVEFDPRTNSARVDDGFSIRAKQKITGVRMDPTHLPTQIQWGGRKRQLTDMQYARNCFLVRENFKKIIEELEPGRHQFERVDIFWRDGRSEGAGRYYWFFPVARLNGMDREKTSHTWDEIGWKAVSGGRYVCSLTQINGYNIWFDKYIYGSQLPFVSDVFKREMDAAGVTGIGYHEILTA